MEQEEYLRETHKIAAYNRDKLSRLPQKYGNLQKLLRWQGGRFNKLLNKIYYYVLSKKELLYDPESKRSYFWISGSYMQRHFKTGKGQHYMTYAACIGIFDKVNPGFKAGRYRPPWESFPADQWYEGRLYDGETLQGNLNHVCGQIARRYDMPIKDISFYTLPKLEGERLDWIDQQAGRYMESGVMPANICWDVLHAAELDYDARRVLFQKQKKGSQTVFHMQWAAIDRQIELLCQESGYTTKEKLRDQFPKWSAYKFDKVWKYARTQGRWKYKKPTKSQKDQFGLTSDTYIITT